MSSQFLESFIVIKSRRDRPRESSFTSHLIASGLQKVISKFGEESSQLITAAYGQGDVIEKERRRI
jgi:phosphoribosyl-ATP pyrophosphohydrolase